MNKVRVSGIFDHNAMTSEQTTGTTGKPREKPRLDLIDGLRGYAIFHVVIFHFWQNCWPDYELTLHLPYRTLYPLYATGFMGVELFFFLSGFCLCYTFARQKREGSKAPSWKEFYWRRFLKIYPSYLLALVLLQLIGDQPLSREQFPVHFIVHLLGVHNFFIDTCYSLSPVLWSLADELQFYAIFPLICGLFLRRPLVVYLAMITVTLGYRWVTYHTEIPPGVFTWRMNQLPGVLDFFGGGMLAAYLVVWVRSRFAPSWKRTLIGSLLLIAGVVGYWLLMQGILHLPNEVHGIENWQARIRYPLSLCFLAAIVGGVIAWRPLQVVMANPILVFFADISYNWYLWHNFIALTMLANRVPDFVGHPSEAYWFDNSWKIAYTLLAFALSIAPAVVLTYGFERPFMKYGIRAVFVRLFQWIKHPDTWAWMRQGLPVLESVRCLGILHLIGFQLWQITWIYLTDTTHSPLNLDNFIRSGYFGVDTLLMAAAFGWFYPFARSRYDDSVAPTWREFYLRQAPTIAPLYLLAAVVCLFALRRSFPIELFAQQIVAHLFFVNDFSLATVTALHPLFYAVAVSVQFLVLFPLVVFGFRRLPQVTFLGLLGIAWGYRWWLAHSGQPSTLEYSFLLNRLPGVLDLFALGMGGASVLAFLQARQAKQPTNWEPFAHAAVAVVALGAYFWLLRGVVHLPEGEAFPLEAWQSGMRFPLALLLVVVVVSGTLAWRPVRLILANPVFIGMGKIVYPLFLFTWILARKFMEWRVPYYPGDNPSQYEVWKASYFFLVLGVSLAVATVLTMVIQRPLLSLLSKYRSN